MSDLKNIFYGDRVVQQAYMNDALIYQADSWQNTPVSRQLVYKTIGADKAGSGGIRGFFTHTNNLIVVDYFSLGSNAYTFRITKFNSSQGLFAYDLIVDVKASSLLYDGVVGGNMYVYTVPAYMDSDNVVHILYNSVNSSELHLLNITDLGTRFSYEDILIPSTFVTGTMRSACMDNNKFYVSIANDSTLYAIDYKCSSVSRLTSLRSSFLNCLYTNNESDFVYGIVYGTREIVQIDKNIGTCNYISTGVDTAHYNSLTVDSMNNIYLYNTYCSSGSYYGYGQQIYKYSVTNKKLYTMTYNDNYAFTIRLDFDSKNNIYTFGRDYYSSKGAIYCGYRYNASSTRDYFVDDIAGVVEVPRIYGDVCVDNYDNIFYILPISSSPYGYYIYKYSNLEKVN